MTINKKLTTVNFNKTNNTGRIKYIVIHYVGALGGAEANCNYYKSVNRNASAHYFDGFDGVSEIVNGFPFLCISSENFVITFIITSISNISE